MSTCIVDPSTSPTTSNSPSDSSQQEASTASTAEAPPATATTHDAPATTSEQQELAEALFQEVVGALTDLFIMTCSSLCVASHDHMWHGETMVNYQHGIDEIAALELHQRTTIQTNHHNDEIIATINSVSESLFEDASSEKWVHAIEAFSGVDIAAYSLLWERMIFINHHRAALDTVLLMFDEQQAILIQQEHEEHHHQITLLQEELLLLYQEQQRQAQQQAQEAEEGVLLEQQQQQAHEAVALQLLLALIEEEELQRSTML